MIVTADLTDVIITLFCNTSSKEFHSVFRKKCTKKLIGNICRATGVNRFSFIFSRLVALNNAYNDVKSRLDYACNVYTKMSGSTEWKGLYHKALAFLVEGCFNYGGNNFTVLLCPKSLNQKKVDNNKKI